MAVQINYCLTCGTVKMLNIIERIVDRSAEVDPRYLHTTVTTTSYDHEIGRDICNNGAFVEGTPACATASTCICPDGSISELHLRSQL